MTSQGTAIQPTPSITTAPKPALADDSPRVPAWIVWGCPFLTAALLYLAYFPVAVGWLAWVALVPLLVLVKLPGRPKRLYLACWLAAMVFHWAVLQWVRVADIMMYGAWIVVATYGACYWPIALAILRWLDRRTGLPLIVTVPGVWVSFEYVRYGFCGCFVSLISGSHQHDVPGGFGWYLLGHTQHDFLEIIQIADLTGAYGVTFLVAAVNALAFEVLASRAWFCNVGQAFEPDSSAARQAGKPDLQSKTALLLRALAVVSLLLAALAYGGWRLSQPIDPDGPTVAIMQTNVPQARRNEASNPDKEQSEDSRKLIWADFARLAGLAARQKPDLIATPETSYPGLWEEHYPGKPMAHSQKLADGMTAHMKTHVLVGMSADILDEEGQLRAYNSSILIGPKGQWLGRYDKIHRVPFGEYIPFSNLPFMKWLSPYDYDYTVRPGLSFTQFPLATRNRMYTFGVMICYEDTDPAMCRPYGGGGQAQADFLLNVSNDGWFHGASEHDQHLAICRFRAVECRRSVGRAVNVGISAIIDPNGRVLSPELVGEEKGIHLWQIPDDARSLPVSQWHRFKQVGGILVGRMPLDERTSFYARYGDWFAGVWLALVSLTCVGMFVTKRKST